MCYGIGISSMMMSPMAMGGGFGGYGFCSPSIWGWGGGCCGDMYGEKPLMFGLGTGIGYGLAGLAVAGFPKFVDWISGLLSKKGKESQAA